MTYAENVTSVSDYIQKIKRIDNKLQEFWNGITQKALFRGQADSSWSLLPSLARNGHSDNFVDYERNLIESAKFRMPDVFRSEYEPIELLALLQHYGIPTRLLDLTENALVALYFACCEAPKKMVRYLSLKHNVQT